MGFNGIQWDSMGFNGPFMRFNGFSIGFILRQTRIARIQWNFSGNFMGFDES